MQTQAHRLKWTSPQSATNAMQALTTSSLMRNDSMAKADLTADRLRELLSYNPDTGVFTRKIWTGGTGRAGTIAGWQDKFGHWHINVLGKNYLAHRLAWLYVYGHWPAEGMTIDHKFGKSNAITNLREVTQSVNMQNRHGPQINNKVGVLGVNKIAGGYRARIKPNGQPSVHLGVFSTPDDAYAAYVKAKRVMHEGGLL